MKDFRDASQVASMIPVRMPDHVLRRCHRFGSAVPYFPFFYSLRPKKRNTCEYMMQESDGETVSAHNLLPLTAQQHQTPEHLPSRDRRSQRLHVVRDETEVSAASVGVRHSKILIKFSVMR